MPQRPARSPGRCLVSQEKSNTVAAQFGRRLRACRIRTYVTQEELAERAGLHRTAISLLERGARMPRVDTLLRLAAALEVEPADILAGVYVQLPERMSTSIETLSPKEKEKRIEMGVLTTVLDLHPEHVSAAELTRRLVLTDPRVNDMRAVERGLGRLVDAELLQEVGGRIAPTRATLHFSQLPF